MHPTITHHLAVENQQRLLERAAADRMVRMAKARRVSRPSRISRLVTALRRGRGATVRHPEPRTAQVGQA